MRGWIIIALLAALPARADAQRKINERFAAPPDGFVRIQNIAGSVKVTGWDRDTIAIVGVVHDTPNERFAVQRSEAGVKLGVWDTNVDRVPPSQLDLRVPARSQVWVQTGSSSIFVDRVLGGVDASSVGGTIEVRGSPRELFVESMTGELVLDVRTSTVRAKTFTGAIRMQGTIADIGATTVSGNITVEGAGIERGRFESVNGDLRYFGAIQRASALDFINHAGAVEFLLPATASAEFTVSTYEGGLQNEFDSPIRRGGGKIKGTELGFTLGTGDARVVVRTFKGRVIVRRK